MGFDLTGFSPKNTYKTLLKMFDNLGVTSSLKAVGDGDGTDSALEISTLGVNVTGFLTKSGSNVALDTDLAAHVANVSNPHAVTKAQVGLSNVQNILDNFAAVTSPGVGQDNTVGYSIGSRWINTALSPKKGFICVDASTGAAVWREFAFDLTNVLNTLHNFAAVTAPTVSNDNTQGYSIGSRWLNTVTSLEYLCFNASTGAAAWVNVNAAGAAPAITTKTANYTATIADGIILCDATSGSFTISLYAASGNAGKELTIIKTDASANTVTIDGNGSETVNGSLTIALAAQNDKLTLFFDGSNSRIKSGLNTSEIFLTGANGRGSTNTAIRRFTTTVINIGSGVTYTDSATLGGTFRINESGLYSITHTYGNNSAVGNDFGLSLNSAQLTTSISSITASTKLAQGTAIGVAGVGEGGDCISVTKRFSSGDVIRAHTSITNSNGSTDTSSFRISKVSA